MGDSGVVAITKVNVKMRPGEIIPKGTKVYGADAEALVGRGLASLDEAETMRSLTAERERIETRIRLEQEQAASEVQARQAEAMDRAKAQMRAKRNKVLEDSKPSLKTELLAAIEGAG